MKIKWDLNELRAKQDAAFKISGEVDLESNLKNRDKQVLNASDVAVDGWMIVESEDMFHVDAKLNVELTIPSTRSLEPVVVKMEVPFQETYIAPDATMGSLESEANDIVIALDSDILDLSKPFEDSILASLPTQVFTKKEREADIMPEGKNWKVISEESYENGEGDESNIEDSPFAALKDLFSEENNSDKEK